MVTGDDPGVHEGKPAPDLLQVCVRRLGVQPCDCMYVGDTTRWIS
ncbi:MAG: hypothetical protein COT71_02035 [Candidatus Andersenbacteria bacterium CG10_big_fil_rev_8_21_14_0_10_54_11]|uniref:HAD family hydrolase n=1 Tax=Candidatus Andersenbacteria bacterium CG10_big_fil_rev_8_21_14_0_10_54_11 TaxID=1974485 RepID=A0A2M6WZL5_9BACT|nr:MAG: hypothetical protein COT71_02035 [Candidatus Andersenbacteria bacterium CG10_big_fil_rev_8_21_14_0_10_54_11]